MDYFVRYTNTNPHTDDKGKVHFNEQRAYLPATDKDHAELMVEGLNRAANERHGVIFGGSYEVVASVWSGKGKVYLSLMCLEQIADEYTNPKRYTAAA